ncbi:hypothetical protein V5799_022317 [Amblyomma americanum]|uniref:Uncharacterized protein n=1 Tax=Amblyomma americanum TaxID=6943 RepID=A0AAQ4FMG0_AMBAM
MLPPSDIWRYLDSLPFLAWETILSFLDAASLAALAEAFPNLECFVFHEYVVRKLRFAHDADELTIEVFHEANVFSHVNKLDFSNCIGLSSTALLGCLSTCNQLQELCCVNCVIRPSELFALLDVKLTKVRKLEWSLHDSWYYDPWPVPYIRSPNGQLQLESIYMELVATRENTCTLEHILLQCGLLQNLHIHSVQKEGSSFELAELCTLFSRHLPFLKTFKFTCERIWASQDLQWSCRRSPSHIHAEDVMIGNMSYLLKPARSRNLVNFEDGPQNEQLKGVEQAVLVMQGNEHIEHRQLPEAVSKPGRWSQVSSLCLVLTAPRGQEAFGT